MLETRANSVRRTVCDYPCISCDTAVMMEAFTDANRYAMKYMGSGCWLQWNAATECDVMLPLAAFPMQYDPATDTMKSCRPVQPILPLEWEPRLLNPALRGHMATPIGSDCPLTRTYP
jgi:hypothetical protein